MKRRLLIVMLAMSLLFSGCNWMDGEHVSVTPHRIHNQTVSDIKLSASNEKELETAHTDLIATGK